METDEVEGEEVEVVDAGAGAAVGNAVVCFWWVSISFSGVEVDVEVLTPRSQENIEMGEGDGVEKSDFWTYRTCMRR
jgi:hypothetical protein